MANYDELQEILAEIESESKGAPSKSWSLDDIDALLAGDDIKKEPVKEPEKIEEEFEEELEDEETFEDEEEIEEEPEEVEETPKKKRKFSIKAINILPKFEEPEDDLEDEFEEDFEDDYEDEEEPEIVEAPEQPKLSKQEEKTVVFDAETIKTKINPVSEDVADRVDDELDKIEFRPSTKKVDAPRQDQTQVLMSLADDEDIVETEVPTKETEIVPETEEQIRERRALAQKTIGIYPIRNDSIEHQIVTEKVEKSAGGMETDRYRERFLNVPKQHLERTADYEAIHQGEDQSPIERDGRIVRRSKFKNTADLEPVPMIVSADAELSNFDKTIVAGSAAKIIEREEADLDGQIKLMGFGEEDAPIQIDEENADEELREQRVQKVAEFKIDADFDENDYYDEPSYEQPGKVATLMTNFINDEYEKPGDEQRIRKALDSAVKTTGICGIIQIVLMIVSAILTGIISNAGGSLEVVGGGSFGCGFINLLILLIASACGVSTLINGVKGIKNQKPNASTGTLVVVVACALEDIAVMLFASEGYTTISLYTAAGCTALALASVARFITLLRAKNNFDFATSGIGLYSTEKISGEDDAFEIGRGLLIGDPEIYYNAKMERPSYFIENSFEDDPADDYADKLIYITVGIGALMGILLGIIHRDFVFAVGTFAAFCSIGIPGFLLIASNMGLFWKNRHFNSNGAAIVGHRAVEDSTDANAYVLDATDIFKKGSSSIIGIKTFHGMRIDDAILYAASMVIESGGPLSDIFDNVILGKKDLLPPVESLAYEERLGLSAWIHGRRVLLGTRDLLINHNVEAPDKNFEAQYIHDGRKVIYLGIAGKIAAMFVIKYQPDKHIGRYLRYLDRAGVSILIRSCDCNITEEMICSHFNLPLSAVKILSPVSGDIFQAYREEDIETAPAGIMHNGTLEASVSAFYEARELNDSIYVNKILATFYTGLALLFALVLSLIGGADSMGVAAGQIVAFQLFWGAIASVLPIIKRRIDR
ncbi:MAG: hypothetical protein KBS43_00390 [Oscillospiraceae bacterium]|nr:hypothetical protein [Candidatus Limimonas coprohippi]MCQ2488349.1 hypothetical protein [Clostridia bacterium]